MLQTLCNILNLAGSKVCSGSNLSLTSSCDHSIGAERPIFCASCPLPPEPYHCYEVKTLRSIAEDVIIDVAPFVDVTAMSDAIKLGSRSVVMHQWTPFQVNATWYAGLAAANGEEFLLWRNDGEQFVHIPEGTIEKSSTERAKQSLKAEEVTNNRPSQTMDLVWMTDDMNRLKVDAWLGGKHMGFAVVNATTSTDWEPVAVNYSGNDLRMYFATTATKTLPADVDLF